MSRDADSLDNHVDLDAVLADYMRRLDRGESLDQEAFIAAHPSIADELRRYFMLASAMGRAAAGSDGEATSDLTDRQFSATVAFTPSVDGPPGIVGTGYAARVTTSGERFRKLRSHAVGGLGEVFLAHDEQLNRVVALKELQHLHTDDFGKKARFLLEGEVTGSLEHPGIVPVYAMGEDEDGSPFYAMRFIRGESLREAIRQFHSQAVGRNPFHRNSLEFRRLLNRFIDICNATAFAHDRGVLHRDMKPENVMLGKFGETLVVDWGMARVLGRAEKIDHAEESISRPISPRHSSFTQEGSALGTPAYMSPEAASGKMNQVGTASDVFSLGATLYCLLTNRPPLQADSLTELLRKAERCDFPQAAAINPRVPKALNAVCCRAMALAPTARYPSPLELAADIERWLGDDAVSAYREPLLERLIRWARRHRTWALAGAASICLVATVSIIALGLINQARRQAVALAEDNAQLAAREAAARSEAVRRFAESRETIDKWLTGFTEDVAYYPGVQTFRDKMLTQAAENYGKFAREMSNDPDLELERGRTLKRLGDLRRDLMKPDAASLAYNQAAAVFTQLMSSNSNAALAKLENANVKMRKGMLAADIGHYGEAEKEYNSALADLQALVGRELDQELLTINTVDAYIRYGVLLTTEGKLETAGQQLRQAIQLQTALIRATPANLKLYDLLSDARVRLGQLLIERGDSQGALKEFSQSIQDLNRLVELSADDPGPLQSRAAARINLATALRQVGHYSQEADAYRAAIADYQALGTAMPDAPVYRENLTLTETDLGQLLFELGRPQEAADVLIKARDELKKLADAYHDVVRFREETAVCLDNLGQAQLDLGQLEESLISHTAADQLFTQLTHDWPDIPSYRERNGVCRSHVGQLRAARGDSKSALESFGSAIKQLESLRSLHPELVSTVSALATVHSRRGDALFDAGQLPEADDAYKSAAGSWKATIDQSPSAEYLHRAALFFVSCPSKTVRDSKRALEYARRASDAAPANGLYLGTLAAATSLANQPQEALVLVTRALEMEGSDRGRDLLVRALCNQQLGQRDDARASLDQATAWIRQHRPGNPQLKRLQADVAELIKKL